MTMLDRIRLHNTAAVTFKPFKSLRYGTSPIDCSTYVCEKRGGVEFDTCETVYHSLIHCVYRYPVEQLDFTRLLLVR